MAYGSQGSSRRTFLKYVGIAGTTLGVSGQAVSAQEGDVAETIELIGFTSGWEGVSPASIEGERNPTLEFEPGQRYRVRWENGDGIGHNFVIRDEGRNNLVTSDFLTGEGDSTEVEFEATEEMATYVCEPHASTMNGDVVVGSDGNGDGNGDGGDTGDDEYADLKEEVDVAFEATPDGWVGITPSEIEGETNPTITLQEGEEYDFAAVRRIDSDTINLALVDENDEVLARSGTMTDHGPEQRFSTEATTDMVAYTSEAGPDNLRGEVTVEPSEDGGDGDDEELSEREQAIQDLSEEADYVFDGITENWEGLSPESIEGATNPTIELNAGETYVFGWINADGAPHNIAIWDADGNQLEATEIIEETNATQTLEFEATSEMAQYICEVHPTTMVGDLSVQGGDGNGGDDGADDGETDDGADDGNGGDDGADDGNGGDDGADDGADDDGAGFGVISALAGAGAGAAYAAKRLTSSDDEREE